MAQGPLLPECWEAIFLFCDGNSLCSVDATCSSFRGLTDSAWAQWTHSRFGITANNPNEGKLKWRQALALVAPKAFSVVGLTQPQEYVFEPRRGDLSFDSIATHPTSSIIAYNMDNFYGSTFEPMTGANPICYRDGETLSFIRSRSNPAFNIWNIALCGLSGCEIVVVTNAARMVAHQGNRSQDIHLPAYNDPSNNIQFRARRRSGIEMVGAEQYLIVMGVNVIYIFRPNPPQVGGGGGVLLSHVSSICYHQEPQQSEFSLRPALCQACPQAPGVFGFVPCGNRVSLWHVNTTDTVGATDMDVDEEQGGNVWVPIELQSFHSPVTFGSLAIGEHFIAGSADEEYDLDASRIRLFHRRDLAGDGAIQVENGTISNHEAMILQEPDTHIPRDNLNGHTFSASMQFIGDLLVSTSHMGNALCIWNARTGTLLKRYEEAFTQRISRPFIMGGGGQQAKQLVCLHDGTPYMGFLTSAGPKLCLWAVPYDWRGKSLVDNLVRREKSLLSLQNTVSFTDSDDDED